MCFIQLTSSRLGKSSRACAPRLSWRFSAPSTVTAACAIRLSYSSVSTRSEFQMSERSETAMSSEPFQISRIWRTPSASTGPSRNTAQCACIDFCILRRRSAVGVSPLAWRKRSRRESAGSAASAGSSRRRAALDRLRAALGCRASEHDEIDQRVGAQPVGAVHGDARRLADRHQARDDRVGIAVLERQNLAEIVRGDAAHVVVHGRQHRDRLAAHIDAGEHP